ncbi:MAG: FKBP-type peptidyl-prolyl cis-trans isomerase [Gemmatimonadetes bacterium]|jgi:FKBP-type peptidyl-prolyl cis-trans isomerase FkpA|nr:FKBP-type peptidyl-prolyl cis-trans isomerase [Gemmatimonadota bacterium]
MMHRVWLVIGCALMSSACGGARAAGSTSTPPDAVELVDERIVSEDEWAGVSFADELNVVLLAMTKHPAGVYYRDVELGTGAVATAGREVVVTYIAYLTDGREVDRSTPRGAPMAFEVGKGTVIRGWDLGVRGMKVGGTRQLVVPARLAYGRRAVGKVPANAPMVFLVRLDAVR